MTDTRTLLMSFTAETCCHFGCGVVFMMENGYMAERRRRGDSWYCPNGHGQHYTDTTEQRLRRELAAAEGREASVRRDLEWKVSLLKTARRSKAAIQGRLGSVLRRVHAGVCPHCRRSFQNLARHMKGQHGALGPVR